MKSLFLSALLVTVLHLSTPMTVWAENSIQNVTEQSILEESNIDKASTSIETNSKKKFIAKGENKKEFSNKLKICVIFLACVGCIGVFMKKFKRNSSKVHAAISKINITEEKVLAPGTSLYLVEVNQENILISNSNGTIQFLTKVRSDSDTTVKTLPKQHETTDSSVSHVFSANEKYHANL